MNNKYIFNNKNFELFFNLFLLYNIKKLKKNLFKIKEKHNY